MTLLTIIQDAAGEVGIPIPSTVANNTDATTVRLLKLANRGGKALAQRFPWQELTREWTFVSVAAEVQGTLDSIMPGFNYDLYQTMWDRSTRFPLSGPLYPQEWQSLKAMGISGPWPQFRIRGNELLMQPIPQAGDNFAGEYVSKFWCQDNSANGQAAWAADDDTGVLSEDLLTLDLVWRWKSAIGLNYSEEKLESEMQVNNAMARNGSNRILSLADNDRSDYPSRLYVPQGNW